VHETEITIREAVVDGSDEKGEFKKGEGGTGRSRQHSWRNERRRIKRDCGKLTYGATRAPKK